MDLTIELTAAQQAAIAAHCATTGLTQEDVVRAALAAYLASEPADGHLAKVMNDELPRFDEALQRLGE
ncbi:MAG: hypothetical protein O2815_11675 [Actinomycetota bacterium]|nr:hypothetical protein [Actinomycetota bacterium]